MPRLEDRRLVTGQGRFLDDLPAEGALQVVIVRSAYAHARIRSIDGEAARMAPGAEVITAADLGPANGPFPHPTWFPPAAELVRQTGAVARPEFIRLLAGDIVRYAGEPVAAVAAEDRYVAEDLSRSIEIDYEPLPVIVDPVRAMEPGAPLLHPDWGTNLAAAFTITKGDPDGAFASADHVVSAELSMPRQTGAPIEPRGVLAVVGQDGGLIVWSSTQAPHWLRDALVVSLGLPPERIRVVAPDVGGGFGTKSMVYPEELLLPALALRFGRAVHWSDTRRENFLGSIQSRGQRHEIELALRVDGTIVGLRDRYLVDGGASNVEGLVVPYNTAAHLQGPYRIPNLRIQCSVVLTNKQPLSAYRGSGRPEAVFATERVIDRAADQLGIPRGELRRRNTLLATEMPYDAGIPYRDGSPLVIDGGDLVGCLERALAAVSDARPSATTNAGQGQASEATLASSGTDGTLRGIGVAAYIEGTGIGPEELADVLVEPSGGIVVTIALPSQGQGHETILAQVCAEVLDVPIESVRLIAGDTAAMPSGGATIASRTAVVVGNAVAGASARVRELALDAAAEMLEAARGDLEMSGGAISVAGSPESSISLAEIAAWLAEGASGHPDRPRRLAAREGFAPSAVTFSNGVHAAAVAVDPETGDVRIERYVVVHDCGRVINPRILEGQVVGGVVQGIGGALFEELIHDEDGQLLNGTFMDYGLPRSTDIPAIEVIHLETPSTRNPLGIKGAGEAGTIAVAAAVAGAVEDALRPFGATVTTVPLTPERVLALMRAHDPKVAPPSGATAG